jgi:hypothetical protein
MFDQPVTAAAVGTPCGPCSPLIRPSVRPRERWPRRSLETQEPSPRTLTTRRASLTPAALDDRFAAPRPRSRSARPRRASRPREGGAAPDLPVRDRPQRRRRVPARPDEQLSTGGRARGAPAAWLERDVRGRAARRRTGQRQRSLLRVRAAPGGRARDRGDDRSARWAAADGRIFAGEPHRFARPVDRHPHQRRADLRGFSHQAPARPHAVHTLGPLNAKSGSRRDAS